MEILLLDRTKNGKPTLMKSLKYIQNILLFSFILYFAQGSLYTQGSLLSQSALLFIIIISTFYFVKSLMLKSKKGLFYKAWTTLLLLNIVGFVLTINLSNSYQFGMFKGVLLGALPFYPFYYFAKKGILQSKHLICFFILMLPVLVLSYYSNAEDILMQRVSENDNLVNNVAYGFVALIPFVFLIKKRKAVAICALALLIFFIIQGSKRGAIITGTVNLLIFIYYQFRIIDKKSRIKGYIIAFVGLIFLSFYAYHLYQDNQYLLSRMQNIEEGSGRNIIYRDILSGWSNSDSFFHLVFGYGFAASWDLAGHFAHNDWLELLSNFGLLWVVVYVTLFYAAGGYVFDRQWDIDKRLLMLTLVLTWFLLTLFSMGYTSKGDSFYRAILFAFLIGNGQKKII